MFPETSVILPTYNRCSLLKRAIDSVVSGYNDSRIIFIKHNNNRGASVARNTGIKHSRGDYIAFLDDDDEWLPDKLARQIPMIKDLSEEVGLVYCWMEIFQEGKSINLRAPQLRGYVFGEMLDKQAIGGCPTIIIKREVVEKVGLFDESLPRGNDGDYWRRITKCYKVDFIPEVLVKVHVGHPDRISVSSNFSLKNSILAGEKRLDKFADDFNKYPEKKANLLYKISKDCFRTGQYIKGTRYIFRCLGYRTISLIDGFFLKNNRGVK